MHPTLPATPDRASEARDDEKDAGFQEGRRGRSAEHMAAMRAKRGVQTPEIMAAMREKAKLVIAARAGEMTRPATVEGLLRNAKRYGLTRRALQKATGWPVERFVAENQQMAMGTLLRQAREAAGAVIPRR